MKLPFWAQLFCDLVEEIVESRTLLMSMRTLCEQMTMELTVKAEIRPEDARHLSTKDAAILYQFMLVWDCQSDMQAAEIILQMAKLFGLIINHRKLVRYTEMLPLEMLEQ